MTAVYFVLAGASLCLLRPGGAARWMPLAAVLRRWIPPNTPEEAPQEGKTEPSATAKTDASTPEDVPDDETVDRSVLEDLAELGGADLVGELFGTCLEDATSRLTDLREAARRGAAPEVRRLAHALKGSCGSMGATEMPRLSDALERVGASAVLSRVAKLLDRLEDAFGRARVGARGREDSLRPTRSRLRPRLVRPRAGVAGRIGGPV